MTEKKQQLSGVLNLRVDEALSREIERIAARQGTSVSEMARQLIAHGVEVERQVEASKLRLPYDYDLEKMRGRVVITAEWAAFTRREILAMEYVPDPDEMDDYVQVERIQ